MIFFNVLFDDNADNLTHKSFQVLKLIVMQVKDDDTCHVENLLIPSPMTLLDSVRRNSLPPDVTMLLQSALSASK